jgi:hypothetical protein
MKAEGNIYLGKKWFLLLLAISFSFIANAQTYPPRPIEVTVVQNLGFGAFSLGATGGTVVVDPAGGRTSTGDVVLLSLGVPVTAAHYTLRGNRGRYISMTFSSVITLTGPGTMSFVIDSANPGFGFSLLNEYPLYNDVYIGGILTVGSLISNPPGTYNGTFDITFNYE